MVSAGVAPRACSLAEDAVLWRCLRRRAVVSFDLRVSRVVGMRTRWEVRDRVARNSSMRRWQMPSPTPLWVSDLSIGALRAGLGLAAHLFAPVTRAKKVSLAGAAAHGAAAILDKPSLERLPSNTGAVDSAT